MSSKSTIEHHALETTPDAENLLIEDRLWWVRGRKAIISEYLKRIARDHAISRIMDIGCGSGGSFDVLAEFGKVVGVEPSPVLAGRARSRGIADAVFEQDATELEEIRHMQVLTMFDVLEHIENDKGFLAQLGRKAADNHFVLLSVPACQFLYGDHDRILHHCRRYTNRTLRDTLETSGYQVLHMSYFMSILFPLVLLARTRDKIMGKLGRKRATVELADLPPILSIPFSASLKLEAFLSRMIKFPIGLWLFALARRSEGAKT